MKKYVLFFLLIFTAGIVSAQSTYELVKIDDDTVQIKTIKIFKDISNQDVQLYVDTEEMKLAYINNKLTAFTAELYNWNNPFWIAAQKAPIQEKIDMLNSAKALLMSAGGSGD